MPRHSFYTSVCEENTSAKAREADNNSQIFRSRARARLGIVAGGQERVSHREGSERSLSLSSSAACNEGISQVRPPTLPVVAAQLHPLGGFTGQHLIGAMPVGTPLP